MIKIKYDDDTLITEYENPPMIVGEEYRTTERINNKAVYKRLTSGGAVEYRLEGETEWKNYAVVLGAAPAGYGLGAVYPSVIYSPEELDACRTCGFYCYVYAGTICGIYFDYANLTVYPIWGNECVQELRPLNTNYCLRRFLFGSVWGAWELVGVVQKKLWENASLTSDFAAQTIALDLSGYDAVYVETVRSTEDNKISGRTRVQVGGLPGYLMGTTNQFALTRREVSATTTGVTFSGFYSAATSNGTSNELPYRIYGIKGVSK